MQKGCTIKSMIRDGKEVVLVYRKKKNDNTK